MGIKLFTQSMTDPEMSFILSTKRNRKHKAVTPRLDDIPTFPGTRKVEIGWLLGWIHQATLFLVRFYFSGGEGEGKRSKGRLFGCFTATEKQTGSRGNLTLPQTKTATLGLKKRLPR